MFWVQNLIQNRLISKNLQLQKRKMFQGKFILLALLCLLSFTLCDRLLASAGNCCKSCTAYDKNLVTKSNPFKIRNAIYTLINAGSNDSSILLLILSKLPKEYTIYLAKSLQNFEKLSNLGLAHCPVNAQVTGGPAYSHADPVAAEYYLSLMNALVSKKSPNSINYKNALKGIISQLINIIKQNPQNHQWSRYGIAMTASLELGHSSDISDELIDTNPMQPCDAWQLNFKYCYVYQENYQPLFSKEKSQHQLNSDQVNSTSFFSNLPHNVPTQTVSAYSVYLDRFINGDSSIYSSSFMDMFNQVIFSGTIEAPDGLSLSAYPNNGYAVGQTQQSIWARLVAAFYGPYLYCRYSDLLAGLNNTCPGTCDTSC